jgi:hypothetical protein
MHDQQLMVGAGELLHDGPPNETGAAQDDHVQGYSLPNAAL